VLTVRLALQDRLALRVLTAQQGRRVRLGHKEK
jgi:hypothetical protein